MHWVAESVDDLVGSKLVGAEVLSDDSDKGLWELETVVVSSVVSLCDDDTGLLEDTMMAEWRCDMPFDNCLRGVFSAVDVEPIVSLIVGLSYTEYFWSPRSSRLLW